MEFGNNGKGNNRQQINVNTRGIQMSNKDGFDPSTMLLGFWNELVSIKFHPALPPSKQTDKQVFDYETVFNATLTIEKEQALLKGIEDKILPAIENSEEATIGVKIASSLLIVSTGVKQCGELKPFVGFFKDLDKSNKTDTMICYEFKALETFVSYDAVTGESVTSTTYAQIDLFVSFLKASIDALTHAEAHSSRHVDNYFRTQLLESTGAKSKGGSSSFTGTRNSFNGFNSKEEDSDEAVNEKLNSNEALKDYMS